MEQAPSPSPSLLVMERAGKIMRRSIHTLLKDFHFFSTTPVIIMLPFSASFLLSQYFYQDFSLTKPTSNSIPLISTISCPFIISQKLSPVIFTCAFSFPFAISSLLMGKALVIQSLNHQHQILTATSFSLSFRPILKPLVSTYLFNMALIVIINLTTLFILSVAFKLLEDQYGFKSNDHNWLFTLLGEIGFYTILCNTMIMSNLSLVIAGMFGDCTGWKAVRKACLLRKTTSSMSLVLSLPVNLGLSAIGGLFRYRVVRGNGHVHGRPNYVSMVLEGTLIASLYSLVIVLETICCFLFIKEFEPSYGREEAEINIDYGGIRNRLVDEENRITNC